MPVEHYENFPVASFLLPRHLRQPIEIIYAFARTADDFADEGDLEDSKRLALLDAYRQALDRIESGSPAPEDAPLFHDLAGVIRNHNLPVQLFRDLLDAFSQDVVQKRYADYNQLLDYCRRSANPIGRLLVLLNRKDNDQTLAWSDAICSALQLINFWQDIAVDWHKQRVYLPLEDLERFGVAEDDIAAGRTSPAWQALMRFQCERARQLLNSGRPLTRVLPGRMDLELKLVVAGGNAILDKIESVQGDVFRHRPVLGKLDWFLRAPAALLA